MLINIYFYLSLFLSLSLSIYVHKYLSIQPAIYLYLSIYLSIYIYISIYPSFYFIFIYFFHCIPLKIDCHFILSFNKTLLKVPTHLPTCPLNKGGLRDGQRRLVRIFFIFWAAHFCLFLWRECVTGTNTLRANKYPPVCMDQSKAGLPLAGARGPGCPDWLAEPARRPVVGWPGHGLTYWFPPGPVNQLYDRPTNQGAAGSKIRDRTHSKYAKKGRIAHFSANKPLKMIYVENENDGLDKLWS